jgi:transcriptional regulator with XRE-family HTH domain
MLAHTTFKIWCKEQGMTAADVAKKLDINISTVYKYWQGISKPTRQVEEKMRKVFGFDTKKMFDFI